MRRTLKASLVIVAASLSAGCTTVNPFFTANEYEVSIGKNLYHSELDTFAEASKHCKKYGKLAVLERVGKASDVLIYVDKYKCVKP